MKIGHQWSFGPLAMGGWVHCGGESSYRTIGLASWHNRRSATWRWQLWWNVPWRDAAWRRWPRWFRQRHNCGGYWDLTLPLLGTLHYSWQEPVWR